MKKRRFSKNRFDLSGLSNHIMDRKESDGSIVFSSDNPGGGGTSPIAVI